MVWAFEAARLRPPTSPARLIQMRVNYVRSDRDRRETVQYRVEKGDVIFVEKLNAEAESEFSFDTVLAVGEEGNVKFGNPTVAGAKVTGKVVKNGKGKKLNILTYRPKKGSMRKMGHRQPYTKIEITEIVG